MQFKNLFPNNMDNRRLQSVRDICPLSSAAHSWLYATRWMAAIRSGDIVVSNRLFTWRRTFTRDAHAPELAPTKSFITLDEWAPTIWPRAHAGWRRFGIQHREAIVFLQEVDPKNPARSWSSHARRHLNIFKKISGTTLRLGTVEEYEKNIINSQVPPRLQTVFINEVRQHIQVHPETIEILIAENFDGILACFVVGNIEEAKQSYYIAGFFKHGTEKLHAKVGLIEWWFARSIDREYLTLNFGHIVGPHSRFESGAGYSNFKTHFGVRRVWWPGSFWKLRLSSKT